MISERAALDVLEGRRRAAERWAELSPDEREAARQAIFDFPDILRRTVVGDAVNGRQPFFRLSEEEFQRRNR